MGAAVRLAQQAAAFRPVLLRWARRWAPTLEDAEDAVQETLLKVHRDAAQFRPGTNLLGWLHAILLNELRNRWRARKAAKRAHVAIELDQEAVNQHALVPRPPSPEDLCVSGAIKPELVQALESLPAQQRSVLVLFALAELSYREIADRLCVPIGTVMSSLWRARRRVAAALSGSPQTRDTSRCRRIAQAGRPS